MTETKLQDKKAILHVLSGLMADPNKLSKTKEFPLDTGDFPEKFHKIVYGAMANLFLDGVRKLSPIEIDGYLSSYTEQYRIFNDNTGYKFLEKLEEIGEPENFDYHYERVRKFSLLRECKKMGIDMSDLYDVNVVDLKEEEKQNDKFNKMSLTELVRHIEVKVIEIRDQFLFEQNSKGTHVAENLKEIIAEKQEKPNYGLNMISGYLNTILRGSRKRKIYLTSAGTGFGKSRLGLANVLSYCVPEIYDEEKKTWVKTGATGRTLFISTELEEEEIKIPALSYIACVEEDRIHDAILTFEEQKRLDKAREILERTPLWIEELEDFDIEDIEHCIEKHINKNDVDYINFDYIHTSLKLLTSLAERGVKNLREDQVLLIMGIKLKGLCNKYDIHIDTSTQLNDGYREGAMDQSVIRGSKALADKMDAGMILLTVGEKDEQIVNAIMQAGNFGGTPTHTINIYKNRGNKTKMVRVWIQFNMGTLRVKDLFVTDYKGNLLPHIKPRWIVVDKPKDEEVVETPVEIQHDELPESFDEPQKPNFSF